MSQPTKMICPDCGAEMNHHAMKLDYGVDDPTLVNSVFGGVLKEAHTCPECGRTELRAVEDAECADSLNYLGAKLNDYEHD